MSDKTFTLEEFDDAVAEACVNIVNDENIEARKATEIIISGMLFYAIVRKHLKNSKKKEEE